MMRKLVTLLTRMAGLACLFLVPVADSRAAGTLELSLDDWRSIDTFVDQHVAREQIPNAVGQLLLVGVPGDASNVNDAQTKSLIKNRGIGGVFLNAYYYRGVRGTTKDRIQAAVNFHNALQSQAAQSSLKLPLILAADAETSTDGLAPAMYIPPVEALTLAATCNGPLIRANAQVTGNQLRTLGVHMVMGPVLDVSRRGQATRSGYPLGTRTFGASPNWVMAAASHYAAGLRDAQMLIIGKHFPGLGSLDLNTNLHARRDFPDLIGGQDLLNQDVQLYTQFKDQVDGLMTAHVRVTALVSEGSQQVVTKSKLLVDGLVRGPGYIRLSNDAQLPALNSPDMLIVTDDLSDMGPTVWERGSGVTLADQAWDAFVSGHDLILIAHVETANGSPARGEFASVGYNDVTRILDVFTNRILDDPARQIPRLRASLRRIVAAKARIAIAHNQSVQDLLRGDANLQILAPEEKQMTNVRIESPKAQVFDGREVLDRTFDAATISLFPDLPGVPNLSDKDPSQFRVAFFVDEARVRPFATTFESKLNASWKLYLLPEPGNDPEKNAEKLEEIKAAAVQAFKEFDKVIFTVRRKDDFTLIDHVRLVVSATTLREKGLVLLHTTPYDIPSELTRKVAFVGSFSQHPLSYQSDVRLLSGDFNPGAISHLPLRLPGEAEGDRPVPFEAIDGMERLKIAVDTEAGRLRTDLQAALDKIRALERQIQMSNAGTLNSKPPAESPAFVTASVLTTVGTGLCALSLVTLVMAIARLVLARKKGLEVITRRKTVAKYSRTRLRIDVVIFSLASALTIAAAWTLAISWVILIICLVCSLIFAKEFFSRTKTRPTDGTLAAVSFALSDWVVLAWIGAAALSGFLAASEFGISLGDAMRSVIKYIDGRL